MICACCGYDIKGRKHSVENGEKQVCDKCWNNVDLFFPEKIQEDERFRLLYEMAKETRTREGAVEVKVIKLIQKDIRMYIGKMRVRDILELYELDKFKEEELEGYQREQYEERTSELVAYLSKCPLAIMPALLMSLRKTEFESQDGDLGLLKIPRKKGAIWIIDGQHRIGGFGKIRDRFIFSKEVDPELFSGLMDYEFPVVFVDSTAASRKIGKRLTHSDNGFSSEDIERTIFFIVNKTQKGISPSLKDALLYRIKMSGIEGLSIIEKEGWRIDGTQIAITLNNQDDSPLKGKVNISGKRGTGKPIQLNSFVTSLERLLSDGDFAELTNEDKTLFLEIYWTVLKKLMPEAFDKKTEKGYMALKALGVTALNWLARDIFQVCRKDAHDFKQIKDVKLLLAPIKSLDWSTKTSPFSSLGGMKGASKAHDMLVEAVFQKTLPKEEKPPLQNYVSSDRANIEL